jgi:hypothetical protein
MRLLRIVAAGVCIGAAIYLGWRWGHIAGDAADCLLLVWVGLLAVAGLLLQRRGH